MTEQRYCLAAGCRKFETCQSPENCHLMNLPAGENEADRIMRLKRDALFTASVGSARNARRLKRKAARKAAHKMHGAMEGKKS